MVLVLANYNNTDLKQFYVFNHASLRTIRSLLQVEASRYWMPVLFVLSISAESCDLSA